MHLHLRELPVNYLAQVSARYCEYVLPMPNLKQPLTHFETTLEYASKVAERGLRVVPTMYLTKNTTPKMVRSARECGVLAAKLYPDGVTTGSDSGIDDFDSLRPVIGEMQSVGMVLCVHGEMPGHFVLDREAWFIANVLYQWVHQFPKLKIVLEHISTAQSVDFVTEARDGVAATITAHHLLITLDDVIGDKLRPTAFCKPVAKFPSDRYALCKAATSGNPKFIFGSDSAPHSGAAKFSDSGCAGCFTAPHAPSILAEVFEAHDALDKLSGFTSGHAAEFWGLPRPSGNIRLERSPWIVEQTVYPTFAADREWSWKLAS